MENGAMPEMDVLDALAEAIIRTDSELASRANQMTLIVEPEDDTNELVRTGSALEACINNGLSSQPKGKCKGGAGGKGRGGKGASGKGRKGGGNTTALLNATEQQLADAVRNMALDAVVDCYYKAVLMDKRTDVEIGKVRLL